MNVLLVEKRIQNVPELNKKLLKTIIGTKSFRSNGTATR